MPFMPGTTDTSQQHHLSVAAAASAVAAQLGMENLLLGKNNKRKININQKEGIS